MQQAILEREAVSEVIISRVALLEHWQGHRRLTRKLIEAFPEKELFTYSIGGMRPFAGLIIELLDIAVPGVSGVVSGQWPKMDDMAHINNLSKHSSKEDLLQQWDKATDDLNHLWPQISPQRFQEHDVAFGQFEGTIYSFILYFIDNEIHHRGQGYVYLRSLGIEPPAFWDRA
jgi:uncharacterized damage-inducible protein DinB